MPVQLAPSSLKTTDYWLIFALSMALSAWLIAIDPVLNRDAILYLRSADAYLQDGLVASLQLYGRPLLSVCFALVHQLTGLPLVFAGLLLTSLYYALFCVAFVATVKTLGGDRRIQILAAAVVLSHPALNDQRSAIVRDPAYWGLVLLAFRELLLYLQRPVLRHQLRWSCYILLASLFRFEGLFFAVLAPLSLLATKDFSHRWRHSLQLWMPNILVLIAALTCLLLFQDSFGQGGGIGTYLGRLQAFPDSFGEMAAATADTMLDKHSREHASIAVLAGLAAILAINICRALSWPWVVVLLWGAGGKRVVRLRHDDAVLLWAHLLICLLYLALFTLINRFMLERYASQFTIFALLFLPFVLDSMLRKGRRPLQRWLVVGLLLAMSLDSVHNNDYRKAYLRDAANWLQHHTPEQASLISNSHYLAYFSGRQFDWKKATASNFEWRKLLGYQQHWQGGDYLAMLIEPQDIPSWEAFLRDNSLTETIAFDGGRHGMVSIVHLSAEPGERRMSH